MTMTITTPHHDLLARISALPREWHGAGSLPLAALVAMVRLTGGHVGRSVETGAGKSTLLLSHLSDRHTVFSVDGGKSVSITRASDLLNEKNVEFVDGPTQDTLRAYTFTEPLDFVLLDGPHGYPFPEMEYWALYRHIKPGGWLVIDDLHIPTIFSMVQFLREDPMFELVDASGHTVFFRRTEAPTFDPYGDAWYEQPYNTGRFPIDVAEALTEPTAEATYRERLVPLIETWIAEGLRVAIFGIGTHTDHLFHVVPELDRANVVAFLDSKAGHDGLSYRNRPVKLPSWAEGHCDLVLCSSFAHEMAQMAMLDRAKVKVVPSHIQRMSVVR